MIGNLINDSNFPKNKDEADSLRNIVTTNEMYRCTIVSADGTASLILFSFQDGAKDQIIAKFNDAGRNAINNFDKYIKPFIKSNSTKDVKIRITGMPLKIVTVLFASIAMGIGIDYSIHFISHYNISVINFEDKKKAIEE